MRTFLENGAILLLKIVIIEVTSCMTTHCIVHVLCCFGGKKEAKLEHVTIRGW